MTDPVLAHALANREATIKRIEALVAHPSVSTDPAYEDGMEGARKWLETRLVEIGFRNLRRLDARHPALYADRLDAPGAPTLLVYAHYDVQPPDPLPLWTTPPFEARIRDGRLYARGASDDKGPALIALDALAAFLEVEGRLPVNVKLLLEGEEEIVSPSLPALLATHRNLLAADAILSADGSRWRPDLVTLTTGARGSGGLEIRVRTAAKDLHSGRWGGVVPNALHVISDLIASLRTPDGRIAVAGFLDPVTGPTEADRAQIAAIPLDPEALYAAIGSTPAGEPGHDFLERLWHRPTIEVNGLWGGYTGPGSKTVIPNEAFAKLTLRLVPGQDPPAMREVLLAHLHAHLPPGASLEVTAERGWAGPYALPPDHPLLAAASAALEETTGHRPVLVRMGASLPITDLVADSLGIDTVLFSFATADEDYHAPNEFLRLSAIDDGLAAWIALLRRVARQSPDAYAPFRR